MASEEQDERVDELNHAAASDPSSVVPHVDEVVSYLDDPDLISRVSTILVDLSEDHVDSLVDHAGAIGSAVESTDDSLTLYSLTNVLERIVEHSPESYEEALGGLTAAVDVEEREDPTVVINGLQAWRHVAEAGYDIPEEVLTYVVAALEIAHNRLQTNAVLTQEAILANTDTDPELPKQGLLAALEGESSEREDRDVVRETATRAVARLLVADPELFAGEDLRDQLVENVERIGNDEVQAETRDAIEPALEILEE